MEIEGHCIVKNEDRYLWFAVESVIDYLDRLLLWDTGSTDDTIKICIELQKKYPKKIQFEKHVVSNPKDVTGLRQQMLEQTKSDWIFILDGDEVWWNDSIKILTQKIIEEGNKLDSIVVPFINLIGDIYHYQSENKGRYKIDDKIGFLTIRAINNHIDGLHVDAPYPLEGYFDKTNTILQELPMNRRKFINAPYLHFTHLGRSSLVKNKKYKTELGERFPLDFYYPESFFKPTPDFVKNVWEKSTLSYHTKSVILSPARKAKRWIK